jgi:hypothetical protein
VKQILTLLGNCPCATAALPFFHATAPRLARFVRAPHTRDEGTASARCLLTARGAEGGQGLSCPGRLSVPRPARKVPFFTSDHDCVRAQTAGRAGRCQVRTEMRTNRTNLKERQSSGGHSCVSFMSPPRRPPPR